MQGWREGGRGRRRTVFALAVLGHVVLVATMWRERTSHEPTSAERVVATTIWLASPRERVPASAPARASRVTRLRAVARVDADPRAIRAPAVEAAPVAPAASAAEAPASAASRPLDLTLSRAQLRAIIAGSKPSIAQTLAALPRASALARLGGEEAPYEEMRQAGGETEVHVHGGCFRLVPTPRAQYDPFNHANERLTTACR